MAIRYTTPVEVPLVWKSDDSIDVAASDLEAYGVDPCNIKRLVKMLPDAAPPCLFHCRAITHEEWLGITERALTSGDGTDNTLLHWRQCSETLKIALIKIEGAWSDEVEGKGGKDAVALMPYNIINDIGLLVRAMSTAAEPSRTDTVFKRLDALRADATELVKQLDQDADATCNEPTADAIARLRERLELPKSASMDPEEDSGEDLPK